MAVDYLLTYFGRIQLMQSRAALDTGEPEQALERRAPEDEAAAPGDREETGKREIVTTQDELDGYFAVKSILRETIDAKRVAIRDTKSYCGILLDDNNRRPICRLWFNREQKYVGVFDELKEEDRIPIDDVDDIYQYADRLIATVDRYDQE